MKIKCPYCKYEFGITPDYKQAPHSSTEIIFCENCDQRMILDTKWNCELQISRIEHDKFGRLHEDRSF